ncbi:hypothetical protein AURDEDRAFT_143229 [Auricularia subglabra TFB-10046 SS5]|nr:hypothetical protein AURDEDRAFT_143229 [Auricularia subglabra TFB-10046 SS5]
MATHTVLNALFVFLPISWAFHFVTLPGLGLGTTAALRFSFAFLAIVPLEKMFDWLAEEMVPFIGAELGDLLEITLNNAVEAALAIFLLTKNRYRLLQTTIVGVVLLHLLLIPGIAFMTGGARMLEQELHSGTTELNHSLLTLGVMTVVLPAAFFAALDRGSLSELTQFAVRLNAETPLAGAGESGTATETGSAAVEHVSASLEHAARALAAIVRRAESGGGHGVEDPQEFIHGRFEFAALLSDERRGQFLHFSHGLAILLLGCYICSRIYLHNPPGHGNALQSYRTASEHVKEKAKEKEAKEPKVGPYVGALAIIICVALMAVTAEWLVDSIEGLQEHSGIAQEWFGLFLLPIISWAADGLLAVVYFVRKVLRGHPPPPESVASGLAIDLSIQFLLFWMPFLVLIAWWAGKPFFLLFDLLEVVVLVAACFLVNFVTADAKTNWAEGAVLVAFYIMIAIVAWFYPGQPEVRIFSSHKSVAEALLTGPFVED